MRRRPGSPAWEVGPFCFVIRLLAVNDPARDEEDQLVAFFEALRPEARRAYERLAAQDRERGEDVSRETGAS